MAVLVLDASVTFDLERAGLLEATFRLDHSLVVPDILYDQELAEDVGPYLKQLGLRVVELDAGEMSGAQKGTQAHPKLSLADCSAMTVAMRRNHRLITGDGLLRSVAEARLVPCSGLLWVLDEIHRANLVTPGALYQGLERAIEHPRCRLPEDEVSRRIKDWQEKQERLAKSTRIKGRSKK